MTHETQTSVVGSCSATNCTYNRDQKCTAGQIEVSFSANSATCATYTPANAAGASDRPSAKS